MLIAGRVLIVFLALLLERLQDRVLVQVRFQAVEYPRRVLVDFLVIRTRLAAKELLKQVLVKRGTSVEQAAAMLDPLALRLHVSRQQLLLAVRRGVGTQRLDVVGQRLVESVLVRLEQRFLVVQLRLGLQYLLLLLFQSSQTAV